MTHARRLVFIVLFALCFSGCWVPFRRGHLPRPGHARIVIQQPGLALIAGTGIYWASDADNDVFFYGGRWYWCDGPYWFSAATWGDPWGYIERPPAIFLSIPIGHPRYYVTERHPNHPRHVAYRQTVALKYEPAPVRREFAEIRGTNAPGPAHHAEPRDSHHAAQPDRGPRDDPHGNGPRAESPAPGSRDGPHGNGPKTQSPAPTDPPGRGPKQDGDESKGHSGGHGHK